MDNLIPHEPGQPHNPPHVPAAPDHGPTLTPAPKKRNWLIIAGIVIVAFLAFVFSIIGCVFAMGAPLMKAGEDFLLQLAAGQVDQAYESTAIKFKEVVPKEAFTAFLDEYPIAKKVKTASFNQFAIENNIYGNMSGTVTGTDGQVSPVHMRLVNENNAWRILYVDFMSDEEIAAAEAAAAQMAAQQGGQPLTGEPVPAEGQDVSADGGQPGPEEDPVPPPVEPEPSPAE